MDTFAVIGGSALAYTTWAQKIAFAMACVAVSWIWFFALSIAGHLMGRIVLAKSSLAVLNRISAVMMWASSIYLAYIIYSFQ